MIRFGSAVARVIDSLDPSNGLPVPDGQRYISPQALNDVRKSPPLALVENIPLREKSVDDVSVTNKRAILLARNGLLDDAITIYGQILTNYPDIAELYFNRGYFLHQKGLFCEAIHDFTTAKRLNPNFHKATSHATASRKSARLTCIVYFGLAHTLFLTKDFSGALEALNKAVAYAEILPAALLYSLYLMRSASLEKLGRISEAVVEFQLAVALDQQAAELRHLFSLLLRDAGRLSDAITEARLATDFKPDFAEAHYHLGLLLAGTGQITEAIEVFRCALGLNPGIADPRDILRIIHLLVELILAKVYNACMDKINVRIAELAELTGIPKDALHEFISRTRHQPAPIEAETDAAPPLVLPDKAPKLYAHRPDKSQGIIDFLRETWGAHVAAGVLTRPDLRRLDPKAYTALANWLRDKNNRLPEGMRIPTLKEANDSELEIEGPRRLADTKRLASAWARRQGPKQG